MNDDDWLDDLANQDLDEQLAQDDYERYLYETGQLFDELPF